MRELIGVVTSICLECQSHQHIRNPQAGIPLKSSLGNEMEHANMLETESSSCFLSPGIDNGCWV